MSFLGNNKLKKMKQKSFSESQHYYAIDGARDPALSDSKLIKDSDCMGGSTEVWFGLHGRQHRWSQWWSATEGRAAPVGGGGGTPKLGF
jgi:hypothetical protein